MSFEEVISTECTKFESFSKEALIDRVEFLHAEIVRVVRENYELKNQNLTDSQIHLILIEQLGAANAALFGASSERYKKREKEPKEKTPARPGRKIPLHRYPNVPVREVVISEDPVPACDACGAQMSDSGMRKCGEQLTIIPKKFEI